MRSNLPDKSYFIKKQIPNHPEYIIEDYIDSGNNAHIYRAHNTGLKADVACKIIPTGNIKDTLLSSDGVYKEAQKANLLQSRSVVKCQFSSNWKDEANGIDCVVLCFDYIHGISLRKYIKKNKQNISISFIKTLLSMLFELFHELQQRSMQHEDLHAGNIIVEDESDYQLRPRIAFRVTDFGVGKVTLSVILSDDFDQTALILKDLLQNVNYQELSARDRFTFNFLNDNYLARHLVERDPTIDLYARNPRALFELLEQIDADFDKRASSVEKTTLSTPFDYLSCEQIGESHSLLKSLYSDQFLGLSIVENYNNLVLTGPRGCGKSTVFKSLSFAHKLLVDESSLKESKYIGIYYRCDDLYFAFPRYSTPQQKEAVDLPMHFITATLLIEVFDITTAWAEKLYKEEFREKEETIARDIWKILDIKPPPEPGSFSLRALSQKLQKERKRAAEKQRFINDEKQQFGNYFGADILPIVCERLRHGLSFLREKPLFFFIDDYSAPKITMAIQENLNRLFMQRTWACFFKLSTESTVSFSVRDIDRKIYVEGREFSLLNLGLEYLGEERISKLKFIEDVFSRRLQAVDNYPVTTLEGLVGKNNDRNYNEVARRIREHRKQVVWGKESLADLCSGDIHYIINLVGRMVNEVGGKAGLEKITSTPKISDELQNKVIRDEAGNFLNNLRGIFEYGDQLVSIVTAFGNVAHSYIMYKNSKNEDTLPPHQAGRVEPYEELELSDTAYKIYQELLRYSVFIEDRRGKSRRGKVVPRLWLRRFLVPHFNLTFSKRDSIELENLEDFYKNIKDKVDVAKELFTTWYGMKEFYIRDNNGYILTFAEAKK